MDFDKFSKLALPQLHELYDLALACETTSAIKKVWKLLPENNFHKSGHTSELVAVSTLLSYVREDRIAKCQYADVLKALEP